MKQRSWYKDPLIHFLIIGTLMFALYSLLNPGDAANGKNTAITIQPADLEWMIDRWEQQMGRAPTKEELTRMVNEYVQEEVLYREAQSLGLDQNDVIIRRRMAQKMVFMAKENAGQTTPPDSVIKAFYIANRREYETPALFSLTHIFYSNEKRGQQAAVDASKDLDEIRQRQLPPERASDYGDSFSALSHYDKATRQDLINQFGETFTEQVFASEIDGWQGPLTSIHGEHLIFISERIPARLPDFQKMKRRATLDWKRQQKEAANKKMMDGLFKRYQITITPDARKRLNSSQLSPALTE